MKKSKRKQTKSIDYKETKINLRWKES